jgi:hypothetical protein
MVEGIEEIGDELDLLALRNGRSSTQIFQRGMHGGPTRT